MEVIKTLGDYQIKLLTPFEYQDQWKIYGKKIFDDHSQIFRPRESLPAPEIENIDRLAKKMGSPYFLFLGLYYKDQFCGWCTGEQKDPETFYMSNSAVLPEHQRRGLYTELLRSVLEIASKQGFQKIYSRHTCSNNAVIIPKLKLGFMITALELSDTLGTVVHLTYYTSSQRKDLMAYRCGEEKPSPQVKKDLRLD